MPVPHVHPIQTERFEVVAGEVRFRLGLRTFVAGPGEVVEAPPGVAHGFANAGDGEARMRVEVRPALQMEEMFAEVVALAEAGKMTRRGLPRNLLTLARLARRYDQEAHAPLLNVAVQRFLLAPLVLRLGRLTRSAVSSALATRRARVSGVFAPSTDSVIACLRLLESASNARWASGAAFSATARSTGTSTSRGSVSSVSVRVDLVAGGHAGARAMLRADREHRPPAAHGDLAAVAVVADRDVDERLLAAAERVDDLRRDDAPVAVLPSRRMVVRNVVMPL